MSTGVSDRRGEVGKVRMIRCFEPPDTDCMHRGDENPQPGFNRLLYQNLLVQLESQIENWNRRAVRDPNPETAHALWLKAEGLGCALRLLYAFEPEFRELVECASRAATGGPIPR